MKPFDAFVVVTNQWFSFFDDLVGYDIRPFKALDWLLTLVFLRFTILWCVLAILGIGGIVSLGETSNQRIGFLMAGIVTFYLLTLRGTLVSSAYKTQHSRQSLRTLGISYSDISESRIRSPVSTGRHSIRSNYWWHNQFKWFSEPDSRSNHLSILHRCCVQPFPS